MITHSAPYRHLMPIEATRHYDNKTFIAPLCNAQGSCTAIKDNQGSGRARLIRSHSSARFCFELSGNSN